MLVGNHSEQFKNPATHTIEEMVATFEEHICEPVNYYPGVSTVTGGALATLGVTSTISGVVIGVFGAITANGGRAANALIKREVLSTKNVEYYREMSNEGFELALLSLIRLIRGLLVAVPIIGNTFALAADEGQKNILLRKRIATLGGDATAALSAANERLTREVDQLRRSQSQSTLTITNSQGTFEKALQDIKERDKKIVALTEELAQAKGQLDRLREEQDPVDRALDGDADQDEETPTSVVAGETKKQDDGYESDIG